MHQVNVEFKARVDGLGEYRDLLIRLNARMIGVDRQVDTYFIVPEGRLKLRSGKIENTLIFYRRLNANDTRESRCELAPLPAGNEVGQVLRQALPVMGVVEKSREIYFVGTTKIHLDTVDGHGTFIEVEAADRKDADFFRDLFGIAPDQIEGRSYSDFALKA